MNQFDEAITKTIEVVCKTCKKKCTHNIVHVNDGVHHFRCSACGAAEVYSFKKLEKGKEMFERQNHAAMMERRPLESISTYSARQSFENGQYLRHPNFGEGYVIALTSPPTKMVVLFGDRKRVLLCGLGSTEEKKRGRTRKNSSQLKQNKGTSAHTAGGISVEVNEPTIDEKSAVEPNDKKQIELEVARPSHPPLFEDGN